MMTCDTALRLPPEGVQAEVKTRQLIAVLRAATRKGLRSAQRNAELRKKVVEEYCVEFEQRATPTVARLGAR